LRLRLGPIRRRSLTGFTRTQNGRVQVECAPSEVSMDADAERLRDRAASAESRPGASACVREGGQREIVAALSIAPA
jgi:hypothetical protein